MGTIKPIYSFPTYDLNTITRNANETYIFQPYIKSCFLTMKFVHIACQEVAMAVFQNREINTEFINENIYNLMEEVQTRGLNWTCPDNYDGGIQFFYMPSVMGADDYNLNCQMVRRNQPFHFHIIRLSVGINYKGYYSNYVCTILINPTQNIEHSYRFLTYIKKVVLFNLRHGIQLSEIYRSAMTAAYMRDQYLTRYLMKEFGYVLSHNFHPDLVINSSSMSIAEYGMTFTVNINLIGLVEERRTFNLCSSNTVLVRRDAPAEILTCTQEQEYSTIIEEER